jgi:serpin B
MITALEASSIENINNRNFQLIKTIKKFSTTELANGVMSILTPNKPFLKMCDKYEAPIEKLISLEQVNGWCSKKTHGKITKILDELGSDVIMILLNAVYFKGDWTFPFNPRLTRDGLFGDSSSKKKKVKMMTQTHKFNYYIDRSVQAIELPYKNDSMSALIILPYAGADIDNFVNTLKINDNYLNRIMKGMKKTMVKLSLPKFEIEFKSNLNKVLKKLGMKQAFTPQADFSGIGATLHIDAVIHKTYLKVDEKGSEAAAVTAVVMSNNTLPFTPKVTTMNVNRPFIFILRSKLLPKNNDLLFIGKIKDI